MSEHTSYELLIATYDDEATGASAVSRLMEAFRQDRAAVPAAASIVKDKTGALTIRETTDIGAKQGAAAGAVAGGLLGLLSRKRGTVSSAALGALLGGVAAHKLDTGIPDPRLEAIGQSMDVASSATVAVVSAEVLGEAKSLLAGLGATLTTEPFDYNTDFVKQMQAGNYRGAMTALAYQAESMVANAGGTVEDLTQRAADKGREMTGQEKSPNDMADVQ
ncbi:MAG: DUF1269 domain-containing protein [Anaerolineales bacterium]|nr:DUF1269 domain-containing protein [Anaerolineales bacterium]MCB8935987.1 DUF1269 domain-containing protein [Promineifilum sp.]